MRSEIICWGYPELNIYIQDIPWKSLHRKVIEKSDEPQISECKIEWMTVRIRFFTRLTLMRNYNWNFNLYPGGSCFCLTWLAYTGSNANPTDKINTLRHGDAYLRRWTGLSLVQIMACCLFGAKPLPETKLEYCPFNPQVQKNTMEFQTRQNVYFLSIKLIWNVVCQNGSHFVHASVW